MKSKPEFIKISKILLKRSASGIFFPCTIASNLIFLSKQLTIKPLSQFILYPVEIMIQPQLLSRLFYASTATEQYSPMEVGNILEACRKNNTDLDVTGMLFFGNGYFLQCLEGSRAHINITYQRIAMDHRHKNIQLLEFKEIGSRYFENWTMKYIRSATVIDKILKETGMKEFNPYLLDTFALNAMAAAFRDYIEPAVSIEKEATSKKKNSFGILDIFKRS